MDIREAAERFARVWEAGWPRGDVDGIAALYAEHCVHRSMPFRSPHVGRQAVADYIRLTFDGEPARDVRFGVPIVDGDRAVVEYRALLTGGNGSDGDSGSDSDGDPDGGGSDGDSGRPVTLAGCAFVRFGADGLVVEARDYWHTAEGHREPTGDLFL